MAPTGSARHDEHDLHDELLRLFARQGRRVPVPVFLSAALLATIAADHVPAWVAGGWLALITGVLVLRWRVLGALPSMTRLAHADRLRVAIALSALNGIVHGLSIGFAPLMGELERALQSILLLGLCAGAVATTAGYLPVFLAFVVPTLVPLSAMWAVTSYESAGGWQAGSIAVLVALFGVVLLGLARDAFRLFRESFEIRQQQVELNRQLQSALEQAQAASQAKTRFLASASHDLRQPMHTLSLFGAALTMRPLDDGSREIAEHMSTALQSLGVQLDALLDISKLDAGVVPVRPSAFSLARFLQRIGAEFQPVAQRKALALGVECPADAVCETDELLLDRIVRNLVDNAIKYTPQGEVRVEADPLDGGWRLRIRDTGIGIAECEQARVFEEFYQVGNPERDRSHGLGLGLSIVRRLADLLGLELAMRSAPQRGTEFSLQVPASGRRADRSTRPAACAALLTGLEVLIVDDEEAVRLGMKVLLESHGCRVSQARCSEEAIRIAATTAPRIVLADLRLRGDDSGIVTVRRLRALYPDLPALLVSGDTAPDRLQEAHLAGIRLLHKPVFAQTLVEAIVGELDNGRRGRYERECEH